MSAQMSKRILNQYIVSCFGSLGLCSLLGMSTVAEAQEQSGFDVQEFRVGVGISAERWAEDAIATIYDKNGKMFPTLSLSYRFHEHLSLDATAGTARLTTENMRNEMQLMPVTVGASLLFGDRNREPFVSVSAGFVQFSEQVLRYYTSEYTNQTYGTKMGVDTKAGVRIGTSMLPNTTQHPRQPKGASQLDLEIAMGYRVHQAFGIGTGLNMNAFRTTVGVNIRF